MLRAGSAAASSATCGSARSEVRVWARSVTTARVMIEEMVQGLAAGAVAGKAGVALPVVDVTAAGRTITLRVELGEAAVAELLAELRKAMAVPGKD